MRIFAIVFVTLFFVHANAAIQVSKVSFVYTGVQLVVTYDLEADDNKPCNISLEAFGNWTKLDAFSVSGDIGRNITPGSDKKIIWNTKADNINFSGEFYVKVIATPAISVSIEKHVAKTLLYPGLGNYRLDNRKYYFLYGIGAYGAVAGSIGFNQLAAENYNNYKSSFNTAESDKYFKQAQQNLAFSYALAGVAASIWAYTAVNTYKKAKRLKAQEKITSEQSQYYKKLQETSYSGYSFKEQVEIKGIYYPPELAFETSIQSTDEIHIIDNDKKSVSLLRAPESYKIIFSISNKGRGDAMGVTANITESNGIKGLDVLKNTPIGTIRKGETKLIEIPLATTQELITGSCRFKIEVKEANGFGIDPAYLNINTQAFLAPNVEIIDYKFSSEKGGTPKRGEKIYLTVNAQNTGLGDAKNIDVEFRLPPGNVFPVNETKYRFNTLNSGDHEAITLEFFTNKEYKDTIINIDITLKESWGRYAKNRRVSIGLNQELAKKEVTLLSEIYVSPAIKPALLSSDVDINIPENPVKNPNKYAIIIGNEDYASRQNNLQIESNVAFAAQDAKIFKEYLIKTLGFEEQKVFLLIDATASEIKKEISKIEQIFSRISNPTESEIIFYYAGHGYPDDATKVPYLVPVDVSTSDIQNGIRLADVTERLGKLGAKKVTLFLDACFTGDGRSGGLVAARTARIKPKAVELHGNTLVFSASSSDQTALPYKEKMHGFFTYFILKKLKESKGNITYGELFDFVVKNVQLESTIRIKPQDPQVNASYEIMQVWNNWNIR